MTYGRPPDQMPPLLLQICLIHLNWERNVSLDCQDHILSVIGKMMAFVIDLAINVLNDFYRVLAIMPWRDRSLLEHSSIIDLDFIFIVALSLFQFFYWDVHDWHLKAIDRLAMCRKYGFNRSMRTKCYSGFLVRKFHWGLFILKKNLFKWVTMFFF